MKRNINGIVSKEPQDMHTHKTGIEGLLVIEPKCHKDPRGFFLESWNEIRYQELGITLSFKQDNISLSSRGVLRGMHFQKPNQQGKLIMVLQGEIFDVAVDIRKNSPTFGEWYGVHLSSDNWKQLWVPPGFAHGFCVTSNWALVSYKCTDTYHPENEASLLWNDPDVGIQWPKLPEYIISEKDKKGYPLKEIPENKLTHFNS